MAAHPRFDALLARLKIPVEYSPQAQAEARALAQAPGIDDPALQDRTHLPFCTIDEPSSKDLDQALHVQAIPDQGYQVHYAIADAAHFVRPGSALWQEALGRGSSYYMPGFMVPMLPRVLSEGVCSLNPGEDRRAFLFTVDLDTQGCVRSCHIERARIRSRAKLSYQGVQAFYDGQGPALCDQAVQESLWALAKVGKLRIALALERGVVPFRRREVDLKAHRDGGDPLQIIAYEDLRRDVERYSEQLSLLCNVEGAKFLRQLQSQLHPIYRVHPPPAPQRLATLRARIDEMVAKRGLAPADWAWDGDPATFADWLANLPQDGDAGQLAQVMHRQAVVSSGRAGFTSLPGVHHGIGAQVYGRFTAPMREIVGIYLHGEACEQLGGPASGPEDSPAAKALRDAVIEAADRAAKHQKALDREANRVALDHMVTQDLQQGGQVRVGVLMGMTKRKLHLRLQAPPLDIKVYLHHLEAQHGHRMHVDELGVQLFAGPTPRFTLGDKVQVTAKGKDPHADRWVFHLDPLG